MSEDKLYNLISSEGKEADGAARVSDAALAALVEKLRIENERKNEEIRDLKQDRSQRKEYADRLFSFMCCYMACVFFLLFVSGCGYLNFRLSDSVLIALLGTTTANVLSLFAFVAAYLFYRKRRGDE